METRLGCGMLCATRPMECETRYAIEALNPLTKEVCLLTIAATDAFDAYHKAKTVLGTFIIVRITYA